MTVKGSAQNGAWPFLRCANSRGQRKNVQWRHGTAAKANSLPTTDGFSVSFIKEPTYTKNCQFGILMDNPNFRDSMVIDYTEVRPAQPHEVRDLKVEFGHSPNSIESTFPEHLQGRLSNYNFMLGLAGWRSNSPKSSRMWSRGVHYPKYGFATQGAVLQVTGATPKGLSNGIVQRDLSVKKGKKYRITVTGQFKPAKYSPKSDRALVWVGDSSGRWVSNVVWTKQAVSLSKLGLTTTKIDFVATSSRVNVGVLMHGSQKQGSVLELKAMRMLPWEAHMDDEGKISTQQGVKAKKCNCDPAKHPSKVTRCQFTENFYDAKMHHILKVTHQKEHMGKADYHKCADVAAKGQKPNCKCCDCNGGLMHAPAFDMATLRNAKSFTVQFNKFSVNANNMDIKPNMAGRCRFDTSGGKQSWCCMATAGKSGKSYGQEYCANAKHGEPCVDCVSFWGRKYVFSHNHHKQPVFQQLHYASNDDHFTVTRID